MKLALILILSLTLSGCSVKDMKLNGYTFEEENDSDSAKITYTLESEVDYDEYLPIIHERLYFLGYTEYKTEVVSDKTFVLTVKGDQFTDYEDLANYIVEKKEISFRDSDGNILLNNKDIEHAVAKFGQISATGGNIHYVSLKLTTEGSEKFALATEKISKLNPGSNYIAIMLNDAVISQPTVETQINSDELIISGSFSSKEETIKLANDINFGLAPVGAGVANIEIIK